MMPPEAPRPAPVPGTSTSLATLQERVRTREAAQRLAWAEWQAAQAAWIRSKNMLSAELERLARLEQATQA